MTKPDTNQTAQNPKTPFDSIHATVSSYWDELAKLENLVYERAKAATADFAKLTNDSIAYATQLSAEWRKLGLEATKRVTESFARGA